MSGHIVVPGEGPRCPRCGKATQIREHKRISARELRRPFYYATWFYCTNRRCKTTTVVLPQHRVFEAAASSSEVPPW